MSDRIFSNKDFYPTPNDVIEQMIQGLYLKDKFVLEPSAGKGNIIDILKQRGANVIACEINKDLATIVKDKCKLLAYDFMQVTAENISHINYIIMNPPFSTGAKHILYAWEIAPPGCEIIALCNSDTIYNDCYRERRQLNKIIEDYGTSETIGSAFNESERKTEVEVDMIKLYKPKEGSNEFDGFFLEDDPAEHQENGIMPYNVIRNVVQRYVGAIKCFDEHKIVCDKMNGLVNLFTTGTFSFSMSYNDQITEREQFKKELQKKAWKYLFNEMNLEKYVTSGVMRDINTFIETQTKIPFTMKNIYKMFEIIIGTREQTFSKSLVEAIDRFTMHTNENRYNVEGWKTNSGHMLNKKFIVEALVDQGWSNNGHLRTRISMYSNEDRILDLIKVLCNITGKSFNNTRRLNMFLDDIKMQPNQWYDWTFYEKHGEGENETITKTPGFFKIKGFKKGTVHFVFNNEKDWELLNRAYAKIKGQVLPEKL